MPRYGRLLADGAAVHPNVNTLDVHAGGRSPGLRALRRAATQASMADLVQLQYKLADWGGGWRGAARLGWFLLSMRRPVVATLHDVYTPRRRRDRWLRPDGWALRVLGLRARRLVVHAEEERRRLAGVVPGSKVAVVPHFVEQRPPLPEAAAAKRGLGLGGRRVVTMLGFITERKGHRLLVEALPLMALNVSAVIAGAPIRGRDFRRTELETLAQERGVADRVVFTGYVGDELLTRILAATDVAACPFRDVSASGSLATWISAGTRIVASDLPAIREYDEVSRGAVRRFSPRTPEDLAAALTVSLADAAAHPGPDPATLRIADALALPRIVGRYVAEWQAVLERSQPRTPFPVTRSG